jgi:ABC-type phosphate/phosphonate transport system substrate-binding protein
MTGRKLSEETRKKISEANIKRNSSPEFRKKLSDVSVHKRACVIDDVWYESIRQASNQLGIKWVMVSDRIKSKSEKFKNWNYAE